MAVLFCNENTVFTRICAWSLSSSQCFQCGDYLKAAKTSEYRFLADIITICFDKSQTCILLERLIIKIDVYGRPFRQVFSQFILQYKCTNCPNFEQLTVDLKIRIEDSGLRLPVCRKRQS